MRLDRLIRDLGHVTSGDDRWSDPPIVAPIAVPIPGPLAAALAALTEALRSGLAEPGSRTVDKARSLQHYQGLVDQLAWETRLENRDAARPTAGKAHGCGWNPGPPPAVSRAHPPGLRRAPTAGSALVATPRGTRRRAVRPHLLRVRQVQEESGRADPDASHAYHKGGEIVRFVWGAPAPRHVGGRGRGPGLPGARRHREGDNDSVPAWLHRANTQRDEPLAPPYRQ
jgi:hypothetical protein